MKKTIIILTLLALLLSSCTTRKYHWMIGKLYYTDLQGNKLDELYEGMWAQICVEGYKKRCQKKKCFCADKIPNDKSIDGETVTIKIQNSDNERKLIGDTLHFVLTLDESGKVCQEFKVEYEPIEDEDARVQTENGTEILEEEVLVFKLNDSHFVKSRQISENEYNNRKEISKR